MISSAVTISGTRPRAEPTSSAVSRVAMVDWNMTTTPPMKSIRRSGIARRSVLPRCLKARHVTEIDNAAAIQLALERVPMSAMDPRPRPSTAIILVEPSQTRRKNGDRRRQQHLQIRRRVDWRTQRPVESRSPEIRRRSVDQHPKTRQLESFSGLGSDEDDRALEHEANQEQRHHESHVLPGADPADQVHEHEKELKNEEHSAGVQPEVLSGRDGDDNKQDIHRQRQHQAE